MTAVGPKAPVDETRLNDRSRIADAQAITIDILSVRLQSVRAPQRPAGFLIALTRNR